MIGETLIDNCLNELQSYYPLLSSVLHLAMKEDYFSPEDRISYIGEDDKKDFPGDQYWERAATYMLLILEAENV